MRGGSSREVVRGTCGPSTNSAWPARSATSSCSNDSSRVETRRPRRHSPSWYSGTGRWCWASAAASWATAHEAEDAFQATFLVLAAEGGLGACAGRRSRAGSTASPCARPKRPASAAARRRAREERVSTPVHVEPPDDAFPDELRDILDDELARLPARHRGAVVLCELEGLSRPEAARRLGIPEGTLSSRLARAKARLRDRLASRGVSLPVAALSAILVREARAATIAVPSARIDRASRDARRGRSHRGRGPVGLGRLALRRSPQDHAHRQTQGNRPGHRDHDGCRLGCRRAGESGPGSQSGQAIPSADSGTETKVAARRDPDDRAAALEKKLDRILDALERMQMSRTGSARGR